MSDSRESSPDTIDIEIDPVSLAADIASRNVRQRRSPSSDHYHLGEPFPTAGHYHIGEPSHAAGHSDSSSEPFEDEDTIPLSVHLRSPSPVLPTSPSSPLPHTSLPSPLPSDISLSPIAGPSSLPGPSSPISPSSPVFPSLRFSTRNEGVPIQWDWMPISIRSWRQAEQVPADPLSPVHRTPPLTLTRESIPHTIPVIVARLRTHDQHLEEHDTVLEALPTRVQAVEEQTDRAEEELQIFQDGLVETHDRVVQAEDDVAMLRQETADLRQETADLRQEVTILRQELAELREEEDRSSTDSPSS